MERRRGDGMRETGGRETGCCWDGGRCFAGRPPPSQVRPSAAPLHPGREGFWWQIQLWPQLHWTHQDHQGPRGSA